MAKYLDQNGLLYFWQQVKANHIDTKVDKETGKGLSTNDFTTELLTKLNNVATGAQVNVIETVKVNGTALSVTDKAVDVVVPTKVSELTNDSGYLTVVTEANLDSALAEKVNAAAEGNHSHSNKTVLDGITAAKVSAWDAAEGNAKTYADGLNTAMDGRVAAIEADYLTSEDAYDDTALKGRVSALEGTAHSHDNKALLDTYTQTEANLADAVAKKHEHANKAELDLIATGDKDKWDAAATDVATIKADYLTSDDKYDDTALKGRVSAIESDYLTSADKYDDTALAARVTTVEGKVATIEGDYLTSADKTELTEAIATAKTEAIEAVLDGVSEDYDTLKEIAAWIESDTTSSAELVTRVTNAEKAIDAIEADYLTSADKTALQDSIDAVSELVDTEGKTVSAYVADYVAANVVVLTNSEIDTILAS